MCNYKVQPCTARINKKVHTKLLRVYSMIKKYKNSSKFMPGLSSSCEYWKLQLWGVFVVNSPKILSYGYKNDVEVGRILRSYLNMKSSEIFNHLIFLAF